MLTSFVTRTDSSCVIDGISYAGLPLLITEDGILEAQSDYLRQARVVRGRSPASVLETIKYLRTHVHIVDAEGKSWEQTTEASLRRWRNEQAGPTPTNARRRYLNQQLLAIYTFLIWAERTGRVSGVVGPLMPSSSDRTAYQLPIEIKSMHRDGTPAQFGYPLLYRTVGESDQRNATAAEVDDLYVALANEQNPYLAERNQLIARFAESVLMRRHEITALLVNQLPSLEAGQKARDKGEELTIALHITKGMKARESIVDPQLVIDTWAFITRARLALLESRSLRDKRNLPIFLSWRTGGHLHPDSISNIFAAKQKEAGIDRASIHHLRSFGTTKRVESVIEMYEYSGAPLPDEETLLLQAQETLGHASTETTKKYIRREKKKRLDRKRSEHKEYSDRAEKLRQLDREIAIREDRVRRLKEDATALSPVLT